MQCEVTLALDDRLARPTGLARFREPAVICNQAWASQGEAENISKFFGLLDIVSLVFFTSTRGDIHVTGLLRFDVGNVLGARSHRRRVPQERPKPLIPKTIYRRRQS